MRRLLVAGLLAVLCACAGNGGEQSDRLEASRINTQLGIDYARQNKLDVAKDKLERAIVQDAGNATAHAALAFVYQQRGDLPLAERHYRRALSLNRADSSVRNNFGVFLCGRGKLAEGEEYLLEAARDRQYPTPEAAWTNAGVCVLGADADKAEQYFREALRVNPKFPDALAQMVAISVRQQDYLRARAFVQRCEQAGRVSPQVLLLAARAEVALGDRLAAHKYHSRLKREYPEAPEAAEPLNFDSP